MVQVFRRKDSPYESVRFKLQGLDANARYVATHLDGTGSKESTGKELLELGLPISFQRKPAAALIRYKKIGDAR
jgi:hypothetical protein